MERFALAEIAALIEQAGLEVLPQRLLDGHARELLDGGARLAPEVLVTQLTAGKADDRRFGRQQAGPPQVVDGGQDLAVGQVAGRAEDGDDARRRDLLEAQALAQRVGVLDLCLAVDVDLLLQRVGTVGRARCSGGVLGRPRSLRPALGLGGQRRYSLLTAWPPN